MLFSSRAGGGLSSYHPDHLRVVLMLFSSRAGGGLSSYHPDHLRVVLMLFSSRAGGGQSSYHPDHLRVVLMLFSSRAGGGLSSYHPEKADEDLHRGDLQQRQGAERGVHVDACEAGRVLPDPAAPHGGHDL
ncbi:hypothetical protein J4Q44_G00037650 [Coregonus suidteri]|uniref:Uncharacterized protein n=1 Tax=Coregonus suidteri TaxID=861788 RepID=A0AAN8R5B9_9TELE